MNYPRVTIQYREAKQPYAWKTCFEGRALYHDDKIILVRGAGSHSIFTGNGYYRSVGFNPKHPAYLARPRRTKGYRVHPKSLERLKALKKRGASGKFKA